jgi:SAM-dependent methyltransferase
VKPYADHFSSLASSYAECRPHYPEELFAYLASLVRRHELAWDCAAGSGQATLALAKRFRRVVATDLSAAMLARAPRHPRVEYRAAPGEVSGLDDGSADLVTVAQALHWLDLDPFYTEVRRVLVPGGALAVWTYGVMHVEHPGLEAALQRFYTETVGPYWPEGRCHVESGYRTLPFPFAETEAPSFVMQVRWTLPHLLGYVRTWSATQRFHESVGRDPVDRLGQELLPLWGDAEAGREIWWPLSVRVGRAVYSGGAA